MEEWNPHGGVSTILQAVKFERKGYEHNNLTAKRLQYPPRAAKWVLTPLFSRMFTPLALYEFFTRVTKHLEGDRTPM